MEIVTKLSHLAKKHQDSVLIIGNFDSVHRGHRYIISEAKKIANRKGKRLALLTFDPHPLAVLKPELNNMNLFFYEDKFSMLEKTELDILFVQTFDKKFAKISPEEFIDKILVNELKISCLVVGEDFRFGNDRSGTTKLLNELSVKHGFEFQSIALLKFAQEIFTSSKIRELLSYGAIDEANNILGYEYFIKNTVIKGKQNGRKIGFPTANLSLENLFKPKRGVYTAIVEIEGRKEKYKAIANLGTRPTVDEQELLEVHIFDFNEEIYGNNLKVYLNKYIRPQIKFKNLEELKTQIKIDVQKAKSLLAK